MTYSSGMLIVDSDLQHHGILGQKWGRRNGPPYPLNSSISTGSKLKTSKSDRPVTAKEYGKKKTKVQKIESTKDINKISNEDLKKANERMRLEQEYARLINNSKRSIGDKFTQQVGDQLIQKYAQTLVTLLASKATIEMGKRIFMALI